MIFYFSCTGNTKWAAATTAAAIDDYTIDIATEMQNHPGNEPIEYEIGENETLGFFFPVHGWRPPLIVIEFISRISFNGNKPTYNFIVCTAGDNVGEAVDIFEQQLAKKGLKADSAVSLIMPESYVGLPFMDVDKPEKEKYKKQAAAKLLNAFIDDIKQRRRGVRHITVGRWPRINSRMIGAVFVRWIIGDKQFKLDNQRCIGCGLCAKQCPVENITMHNGKPEWQHNGKCMSCFSCYHHCPVRAIEYGKRTKGKGQYFFK